jgi:hypothetical protein
MFIPHEKMVTINLPPLSLLGAETKGFSSLILPSAYFERYFELIHKKDVPLVLLSLNPIIICSSFSICRLLNELDLVLFQQLVLMPASIQLMD